MFKKAPLQVLPRLRKLYAGVRRVSAVRAKEKALYLCWEVIFREHIGEVVYEVRAAKVRNPRNFLLPGCFKEDILLGKATRRKKPLAFQPTQGGFSQKHRAAIQPGSLCFVAHNLDSVSGLVAAFKEADHPGEGGRRDHAGPVGKSLKPRPHSVAF